MAVTAHTYTKLAKSLVDKLADLDSDALKVMLLSAYTPDRDAHQFVSDVLGAGTQVPNGSGYTTGGAALTTVTFVESGHAYILDCDDPSWTGATFAAAYAVFYDSTPGSSATNPVLNYWDFGGTLTGGGGAFTLVIDASGLLVVTAS